MSMKLMVRILEEIEVSRPQQLVLLSMAENANDDGSSCYPSVALIAWKAGYKPRAVIDIMRQLRHDGVLEEVCGPRQHRPTEYHIHIDKAPRKQSFEAWQKQHGRRKGDDPRGAVSRHRSPEVQNHVSEVQNDVQDTRENAPEPVIEPAKGTSQVIPASDPVPARKPKRIEYTPEFEAFWREYPKGHGTKKLAFDEWTKIAPDAVMIGEIMAGLEEWKRSGKWRDGFIVYAERFLKNVVWENQPPPERTGDTRLQGGNVTPIKRPAGQRGYSADELMQMGMRKRRQQ